MYRESDIYIYIERERDRERERECVYIYIYMFTYAIEDLYFNVGMRNPPYVASFFFRQGGLADAIIHRVLYM